MDRHVKFQSLPRTATPTSLRDAQASTRLNDNERAVLAALREIGYGQVEVVVYASRIVQITRSHVEGDRVDHVAVDADPGHIDGVRRDAD